MQDITNLVLFARIIRAGSISAAARDLGMPKSTLSRRLSELESAHSLRLVHRGTRKLTLTDVGQAFLVHCEVIAQAAEAANQLTQQVQSVPRGELRFSCPYALSQICMARLLPEFMLRYPEVKVHMLASNQPVNLVEDRIDVALRVRDSIVDSALIARPLAPAPTSLYASPTLIADRQLVSPLDLLTLPALSMHYSSGRYEYQLQHSDGEKLMLRYQPSLITDDMWVLREAAANGIGVVALPDYLCRDYVAASRLIRILPQWSLPAGIIHLVYAHRSGLLPAVRAFIDYLVAEMPVVAGVMTGAGFPSYLPEELLGS